jgi:hypothetical protein
MGATAISHFAGRLVNDVICRREELSGYEVDDLTIWPPRPIDFRSIPKDPEVFKNQAAESLTEARELTIFPINASRSSLESGRC